MTTSTGAELPNPILPGFNPDPSAVAVDGVYYVVTSTFEYLPGLPVYRSHDFADWELIGHVGDPPRAARRRRRPHRPRRLGADHPPPRRPLLRHRRRSRVRVALRSSSPPPTPPARGATAPVVRGLDGIDPDLTWDDEGTAYITFSGLILSGPDLGRHLGIQQARVDLATGTLLEEPRSLWSGSGFMFPEAPHLYHRGDFWYLMIAEGGTERGHGVSIARGSSPEGPFTAFEANPFLTARSTIRPVQNTGHGDLVEGPGGQTLMVLLGVRPGGGTRAFSPLGRETYVSKVDWVDDWPVAEPILPVPGPSLTDTVDFTTPLDGGWIGVRRLPQAIATVDAEHGGVHLVADGSALDDTHPTFIGRRQLSWSVEASTTADVSRGRGGLGVRYDEETHYEIEAIEVDGSNHVTARAAIPGLRQEWTGTLPAGPVTFHLDSAPATGAGFGPEMMTSDFVSLWASAAGREIRLASVDGRYLSAETAASFTGRVIGLYASEGTVTFAGYDAHEPV